MISITGDAVRRVSRDATYDGGHAMREGMDVYTMVWR